MKQSNRKCHSGFLSGIEYYFLDKFNSHLTSDLDENYKYTCFPLNIKRKFVKISFFSAIFALNSFNVANAVLSSTTSQTIQGTKPQFFATETTIDKLGFHYKGSDYSESKKDPISGNKIISSNTIKYFDKDAKLSDFVVKSYFTPRTAINDLNGDYFDVDGDAFDPTTPITSTLIAVWKDSNGKVINSGDYDDAICNPDEYPMPLQLEITAKDIKVKTAFGKPDESDPVSSIKTSSQEKPITKTYKIMIAKPCFVKPNGTILSSRTQWRSVRDDKTENDEWNIPEKAKPNEKVGGGHTNDYVANRGFKVEPEVSEHFPTTGFPGAQFQFVMSGKQKDYTFTSSSAQAPIDENGIVTLKGPVKEVTISAALKSDSNIHYDYTFKLDLWVEPGNVLVKDQAEARSKCVSPMSLLKREDLNKFSEYKNKNLDNAQGRLYNVFTRGIGLGVLGEWGRALGADSDGQSATYPKSNWNFGWYFTDESRSFIDNNNTFTEGIVISSHDGMISFPSAWGLEQHKYAVCGKKIY